MIPWIAAGIRSLIQLIMTWGIASWVVDTIFPVLEGLIAKIMSVFGVDEEEAKDIMANEWVDIMEEYGIAIALMSKKIPTRVAEYLGFTSRGYKKRTLKPTTAQKLGMKTDVKTGLPLFEKEARAASEAIVSKAAKTLTPTATKILNDTLKVAGVTTLVGMTIAQFIDFGAWNSSAYQKQFQEFLKNFGLTPDPDRIEARTISYEMFDKIYNIFKIGGAISIKNIATGEILPFGRENLSKVIDQISAIGQLGGESMSVKGLIASLIPLTTFITTPAAAAAKLIGAGTAGGVAPQVLRVFTGIIANGTLTEKIEFTPRPETIISNMDELLDAAQNNLVEYLRSLPGRIIYEIKLVNSVTDKNGMTRTGQKVDILIGYRSDGTPKYRSITNKWAIANLYFTKRGGTKTKIDTIILGPTDATKLNPAYGALQNLQNQMQATLVTPSISDISTIKTSDPITVTPVVQAASPAAAHLLPAAPQFEQPAIPATAEPAPMKATEKPWPTAIPYQPNQDPNDPWYGRLNAEKTRIFNTQTRGWDPYPAPAEPVAEKPAPKLQMKTLIEIFYMRPDVEKEINKSFPGQNPLIRGTAANIWLNDWWNTNGKKEMPNIILIP